MKRVIIESPYAGADDKETYKNVGYAMMCMFDCLKRGEAPFASHLLYPLVLDDKVPDERMMGIKAGLTWGHQAEMTVVYIDLGVSPGMVVGIDDAKADNRPVEFRSLPTELMKMWQVWLKLNESTINR